jgi:lipooligosaccharide transport system ATP-binding protein
MAEAVIRVENVCKHFGELCAVDGLSFEVEAGTCFGFLGPNGAGKTTLMKMLYARTLRDDPAHSTIRVFGFDPLTQELDIKYLSGVVGQEDNLDEELNVVQNLQLFARFYNLSRERTRRRIDELLDFMELGEKRHSLIRHLSGGMKRRLVIARALLHEPRLLIFDEPTTGLDPQVRHLIWDKLRQLRAGGATLLLTTHYMEEAFQLCDRLLILHNGRKVLEGPPRKLLAEHVESHVLELPDELPPEQQAGLKLPEGVRQEMSGQTVRFYADRFDALRDLADRLAGRPYFLRQTTLEDLFLKATGRNLNEKQ